MTYAAPLRDIKFVLDEIAGLPGIADLPGYGDATPDLVDSILTEAAKIAETVLAPLNRAGDTQGAYLNNGKVVVTPGWNEAWATLTEGSWNGVSSPAEYGGMGLPEVLGLGVAEMWQSANLAFALCPMLTQGAVNAIRLYGSDEQKARYLPRMVSGEWTGTMDLTESQAGSDLAAVRTRAVPDAEGYRITGQKIFITYGDHEMTSNIIHLVLARLLDAPAGVKGISLFIVPKMLLDANGGAAGPNDVVCASLEHKLGIHGSPTAVLAFGDRGGAWGELIGEPNRGLEYMFAMMNHARLGVGLQGLAIAERAYQQALAYARDRVQGTPLGFSGEGKAAIVHHPDVRRMLATMKARIDAMRGLLYEVAAAHDIAHAHPDETVRAAAQRKIDLLTPVAKGWCTENGIDITSLGVQIHGGMGYIEETGAAQHWRDARITTIYEGTTGIQANDLIGRKLLRDKGTAMAEMLAAISATARELQGSPGALRSIGEALLAAAGKARDATEWVLKVAQEDPRLPYAAAVPFLHLMGVVTGAHVLARAAKAASGRPDPDGYYASKIALGQLYAAHVLPQAASYWESIRDGSQVVFQVSEAHL